MRKISVKQFIKEEDTFCTEINKKNFNMITKYLKNRYFDKYQDFENSYNFFIVSDECLHADSSIRNYEEVDIYDDKEYDDITPAVFNPDSGWKF